MQLSITNQSPIESGPYPTRTENFTKKKNRFFVDRYPISISNFAVSLQNFQLHFLLKRKYESIFFFFSIKIIVIIYMLLLISSLTNSCMQPHDYEIPKLNFVNFQGNYIYIFRFGLFLNFRSLNFDVDYWFRSVVWCWCGVCMSAKSRLFVFL